MVHDTKASQKLVWAANRGIVTRDKGRRRALRYENDSVTSSPDAWTDGWDAGTAQEGHEAIVPVAVAAPVAWREARARSRAALKLSTSSAQLDPCGGAAGGPVPPLADRSRRD